MAYRRGYRGETAAVRPVSESQATGRDALVNAAVDETKLAPGAVRGDRLGVGGVPTEALADDAVDHTKIARLTGALETDDKVIFGGDANLYRGAANRVKTDDQLQAADGIVTKYLTNQSGDISDSDFTATPPNGTFAAVHSTVGEDRAYVRLNGVWKRLSAL